MDEQDNFYGTFYIIKNGRRQLNFGSDLTIPFNHCDKIIAKWDNNKKQLIVSRLDDVVHFGE
jgi:hypothetical protein